MARCMKLRDPYFGPARNKPLVSNIWNLSHGVGTPSRERNQPTDVELVQRLLMLLPHGGAHPFSTAVWSAIKPTGHMDHATRAAIDATDFLGDVKHGNGWRISPARYGLSRYRQKDGKPTERSFYYIVMLQLCIAQLDDADTLNALPEACSPALRRELLLPV